MNIVKIALAKGRIAEQSIEMLESIGIKFEDYSKKSRKLIFEDTTGRINMIFVKSGDVPTYVEKGAADIGIVGKDVILEEEADIYEVLDLGFGKCKMCVCGYTDYEFQPNKKLAVASKYTVTATNYFNKIGIQSEIIKLNGSVELAPIIGLADVIVDIVETGTTLKENNLGVIREICDISARLVVNKVSLKTKASVVGEVIDGFEKLLENKVD